MSESKALAALQAENARLAALLEVHGIEWRQSGSSALAVREPEPSGLSTAEKVDLWLLEPAVRGSTCRWKQAFRTSSGISPTTGHGPRLLPRRCERPSVWAARSWY